MVLSRPNVQSEIAAVCNECKENMLGCTELHPFYFGGAIASIIGALIVIISYIITPVLRYHPSILIFYRSIFDLLFAITHFSLYFINTENLICSSHGCTIMGNIDLFFYLCSTGSFIALLYDLYQSIKNPFSSPRTKNIKLTNSVIICGALSISLLIILSDYGFLYDSVTNYCSLKHHSTYFNPYQLMTYFAAIIAFYVAYNAFTRLIRTGLPDSLQIRRKAIMNAVWYCVLISGWVITTAICYAAEWHIAWTLFSTSFGVSDFIIWIFTNFDRFKAPPTTPKSKKQSQKKRKNHLKPKHPKEIYHTLQDRGYAPKDSCCSRIGVSVVETKFSSINEALRREVLAYTTDGIAQSLDLIDKNILTLEDMHYPLRINDDNDCAVTRFCVELKKNHAVIDRSMTTMTTINEHKSVDMVPINRDSNQSIDVDAVINSLQIEKESTNRFCLPACLQKTFDAKYLQERRFCDFAPLVFKYIRTKIMGLDDEAYKKSIIPSDFEEQLRVLKGCKIGDGKSGAFFFITHDSKYVIKTLSKSEVQFLLNILKDYVDYLETNPDTILSRYVGLHSLSFYGLVKYFVVMENVFNGKLKPSEVYDLKGSWVNRYTKGQGTMKDVDLTRHINMDQDVVVGLIAQLANDSYFLRQHNIMDYSVLLGIYYMKIECETDRDEEQSLTIHDRQRLSRHGSTASQQKMERLDTFTENAERGHYLGGFRARIIDGPGIYYIGIIDTLQEYNLQKKVETWWKTYVQRDDANGISCVNPEKYQKRFMSYFEHIIISEKDYKSELGLDDKQFETEKVSVYPSSQHLNENLYDLNRQRTSAKFNGAMMKRVAGKIHHSSYDTM